VFFRKITYRVKTLNHKTVNDANLRLLWERFTIVDFYAISILVGFLICRSAAINDTGHCWICGGDLCPDGKKGRYEGRVIIGLGGGMA